MRLWSLHPRYLDAKGLVALWREGLLAQAVLAGQTRGYRNHPQLERFREHENPRGCIALYLHHVADEAEQRGYHFDRVKLPPRTDEHVLAVSDEQLRYEWTHLRTKLQTRDPSRHARMSSTCVAEPHPLFVVVKGPIAAWERRSEESG